MRPFDPTKPVQRLDGTPVRILCTDRDSDTYPVVVMLNDASIVTYTADGKSHPEYPDDRVTNLVNTWFAEALQAGMKVNPGHKPDDHDDSRPVLLRDGTKWPYRCSWSLDGVPRDIALYWPKPQTITLELTMDEAETLLVVCENTGGDPFKSRRGDMDKIGCALRNAGVQPSTYAARELDENLFFNPRTK